MAGWIETEEEVIPRCWLVGYGFRGVYCEERGERAEGRGWGMGKAILPRKRGYCI